MGAPKQKWTAEEEAALRAGVEKYGPGKWRAIQKDSKFGPCLTSRSNVDLKVPHLLSFSSSSISISGGDYFLVVDRNIASSGLYPGHISSGEIAAGY